MAARFFCVNSSSIIGEKYERPQSNHGNRSVGRDRSALADVENEIKTVGGDALTVRVDVTVDEDVTRAVDEALSKTGRLDVLVNAAGHISTGTIEDTSLTSWDAMMNVNLRSVFRLMQLA